MSRGTLFVGTSGWVYPDWQGIIYPKEIKSKDVFSYYAKHFHTVELNATFYHFPRASTVEKWKLAGGKDFVWAVKAWRWMTHIKRLKGVKKDAHEFLARVQPIASEGAILFQLPPSMKKDLKRLERFLKLLPTSFRFAIEFRHNSWFSQDTYELLRRFSVALVGVDAPKIERILDVRTASFVYFRFHGSSRWYVHNYTKAELNVFAQAARGHLKGGDLFVYFDNTAAGHAFRNALDFQSILPVPEYFQSTV
ncbi:MAG: DUF72 domain-containing protein [Candidatus Omnitrophica bacterium]|nr:DUF72 domain-containing protein [Candidatus Omnitrophota bacterium]